MRLGFVGVAAPALFLCGIILGCDSEIASAPVEGTMEVRAAWSVGEPAPYDGVLVPGVFKVCTASSGGTGTYTIASNGSPGRVIAEATIPSGQCLNVFQAKKNEKVFEWLAKSQSDRSSGFPVFQRSELIAKFSDDPRYANLVAGLQIPGTESHSTTSR